MALISVATARLQLPDVSAGASEDAIITQLILDADAILARWCGFPPPDGAQAVTLEEATYVDVLDGPLLSEDRRLDRYGTSRDTDGTVLELRVRPVTGITDIHDDPSRAWPAATLVAATDYEFEASGRVYLLPDSAHGAWSRARRAIRVEYEAGFTSAPPDVARAAALMVRHLWDLRYVAGRSTVVADGGSESRREEGVPSLVREILSRYRLWEGLG